MALNKLFSLGTVTVNIINKNQLNKKSPKIVCPICDGFPHALNHFNLLGIKEVETFECLDCGLYFRSPLPSSADISMYYQKNYFRYPDQIQQKMAVIQGGWILNKLNEKKIDLEKISYIEFGAGRGWLLDYMTNNGFDSVVGYEPDIDSVEFGRNKFGVNLCRGFASDDLFAKVSHQLHHDQTPLISFVHVLEHLESPIEILNSINRQFHKAYLFMEVPNGDYEGPLMELDTFPQSSMGQHFWSFTPSSLILLLEKSGFSVILIESSGSHQFWNYELFRLDLWKQLSTTYTEWEKSSFTVKDAILKLSSLIGRALIKTLKIRLRKVFGYKFYDRVDMPVIRVLAVSNGYAK